MKLDNPHTLAEIAALAGCAFAGDGTLVLTGINEIHRVEPGDVVFTDHPKYYAKSLQSAASAIIINQQVDCPEGKGLLFADDPFAVYNRLTRHFCPPNSFTATPEHVQLGLGCQIHPTVSIGKGVTIGNDCIIHAGVVIGDRTHIGHRVIIHANTVLGADAFYYKGRPAGREKMYSCGNVVLEDDVEIGALCTIDRGVSADTRIGAGTKLDDHVHIGHDTLVGRNCLFAAQVGLAGCVVVEDDVVLWGQVGVVSDVRIGKGAVVFGQSGVSKDLPAGHQYFGSPAEEARAKYREVATLRKISDSYSSK
jgi:UDP-3-O-[3-hydroxymyristoyl] glucosamine N-acyltransferase